MFVISCMSCPSDDVLYGLASFFSRDEVSIAI
jgi:hypothetical protein